MKIVVECPAKVNLFLSVGPRDASGYHPIRTLMQAVGLFDTISITTGGATCITSSWPDLPEENTLSKALRLVGELEPVPSLDIYLEKRIPAESGLGGGSSDAAGLLRALQRVLSAPLPDHALMNVAAAVGMDVPFFLMGGRAAAEGYGDKLTPLADMPRRAVVVVKPDVGSPTAEAYRALDDLEYPWRALPAEESFEPYNDFERVAPHQSLDLIELLRLEGATAAGLSGSGSAVFGVFDSDERAAVAQQNVLAAGYSQCWMAPTLSRAGSLRMTVEN